MCPHRLVLAILAWLCAGAAFAQAPFESTPEMRDWAWDVTRACRGEAGKLDCLQRALFAPDFGFDYARDETLTATQAFERRAGNCFAFTALFIALSRSVGVDTELVRVPAVRDVYRERGIVVVSGHLAVLWRGGPEWIFYDFGAQDDLPWRGAEPITDHRGAAMYHGNLAMDRLRAGDTDGARLQLEASLARDPSWPEAWVNLGVVQRRAGDLAGAYLAYTRALDLDPDNSSALANLAWLHAHAGDVAKRDRVLRAAASHREVTAYTLLSLARVELSQGRDREARRALRKARLTRPGTPEVHEALAWWAAMEGDPERAERHARKATRLRGPKPGPSKPR